MAGGICAPGAISVNSKDQRADRNQSYEELRRIDNSSTFVRRRLSGFNQEHQKRTQKWPEGQSDEGCGIAAPSLFYETDEIGTSKTSEVSNGVDEGNGDGSHIA